MISYDHLVGVPYVEGSDDCFGLARRFFKDNFDLEAPNFARPTNWDLRGLNLFLDHYRECGFDMVDVGIRDVRIGDVFLIAVHSPVPNHCAIYVGQNRILHHLRNRFSEVCQYKGLWRNNTCGTLRNSNVPHVREIGANVDLMDYITPYMRRKLNETA